MRTVCVINNHNYERFLGACLDSALNQTHPFDAIIVVDDGSTDGSHQLLAQYEHIHPQLTVLRKKNSGQLSCFNAALHYIEEDDWVFFLDADDLYPPNYVEQFLAASSTEKGDFYYATALQFSSDTQRPRDAIIDNAPPEVIPLSSAITLATRAWIGSPTSALVISGWLLHQLLPYPFERDWITRADDVLVFGASIIGARKVHLSHLGIGYRIHGNNLFAGRKASAEEKVLRAFRLDRLFNTFCHRAEISNRPDWPAYIRERSLLSDSLLRKIAPRSAWYLIRRRLRKRIIAILLGKTWKGY